LLVKSLRISLRLSILLSAIGGYLLMLIGNWLVGSVLFAGTEDEFVQKWHTDFLASAWLLQDDSVTVESERESVLLKAAAKTQAATPVLLEDPGAFFLNAVKAPGLAWWHLTSPVIRLFHPDLTWTALAYLLLRIGWHVIVWALAGGIISRLAAFAFTKDASRGLFSGASEATARFPAHALAPLLAASAILLVALPLVLVGLVARLDWIAWAVGILWLIALLFGLFLAVLVIGLVFGWPLMWATIAVEQSDAFDAVSRMYAYVYQRPLHLACYGLFIAALAIIGSVGVHLFLESTITLADWAVGWGRGTPAFVPPESAASTDESTALSGAVAGRRFWMQVAASFTAAYPMGLLFTAAVGAYLLLRLHVDAAQTDEMADDELESLQSLPQLTPHESGIPEVGPSRGV
jgi:hypothetical protein